MGTVAGFLAVFNVWSSKRHLQPNAAQHPSVNIYHEKNSGILDTDPYSDLKRKYIEAQGIPWTLSNKRPDKFRDTLDDFEELLENQFVASIAWRNTRTLQFLLSNGAIILITIATDSADIEKIYIDKSLVGKLPDFISSGVIEENFIVLSFMEKSKLMLVNFSKKTLSERREMEKLSSYEPKLSIVDLPGPSSKRIKRHCLCNIRADLVCVWWGNSIEEAWPWSPLGSDTDRANLVLLSVTSISSVFSVEVVAYMRTDGDPIDVSFSHFQAYQLMTVEQTQSSRAKYLLEVCTYELFGEKIVKISTNNIPIKARVVCQCRNYQQDKLALVCGNNTLVLWDEYQKKAKTVKASFPPSHVAWHPDDTIFIVTSGNGDIQIFDLALNCLHLQLLCDDFTSSEFLRLSQYFFTTPKLKQISWAYDSGIGASPDAVSCSDDLLLIFERGPVCVLRLEVGVCTQGMVTPIELTCEYMKYDQVTEAVGLLNSLNWNQAGSICFQCLVLVTDYLFKQDLNPKHEACIEDTLGSFYAPPRPLHENVILHYRDDIGRIARRFFHHLLRHQRFEKAFLLAVDIGAKDLFMDIHYLAQSVGNLDVADASKERAMQIHYRETNEHLDEVLPVNYHSDNTSETNIKQIDEDVRRMNLTENQKSHPNHTPPSLTSSDERTSHSPLRGEHFRQLSTQPVRYSFADSEDEENEDPIAWALASRSGHLNNGNAAKEGDEPDDLHLVHFGNV